MYYVYAPYNRDWGVVAWLRPSYSSAVRKYLAKSPYAVMVVNAFYCYCYCMNVLLRMNAFSTFNQEFLFLTRVIVLIKELCIFMFSDIWWPRG